MIKGNFLGAAIVAIIYTVYILWRPLPSTHQALFIVILVVLNALTIILMRYAFK